jgi:hypothetical protein
MGIEALNSAAWAAGFAMAGSEEAFEDTFEGTGATAKTVEARWTPGEAVLVREPTAEKSDWLKALLGLFGRRARVSPA